MVCLLVTFWFQLYMANWATPVPFC